VTDVVIVGAGIVGTMIAYQLSLHDLQVSVIDADQPGSGATSASLGVMMAVCSQKLKGHLVDLRLQSLCLFEQLVPELIELTGQSIRFNRSGILCLYKSIAQAKCEALIGMRQSQGYSLEWLDQEKLRSLYPQIVAQPGLYSPQDRMVSPQDLIAALVLAAKHNGVKFELNCPINNLNQLPQADFIVLTAGLGTNQILANLDVNLASIPSSNSTTSELLVGVGGQAIALELANLNLKIGIHAETETGDINLVPLCKSHGNTEGSDRYWLGATVEFDSRDLPNSQNINTLLEQGVGFCPQLANAKILSSWAGYRPRPQFQRSPILGFLPNHPKILIATGHYRNGVLMAPITAEIIKNLILTGDSPHPWREFSLS
jgi:glycine oxidase